MKTLVLCAVAALACAAERPAPAASPASAAAPNPAPAGTPVSAASSHLAYPPTRRTDARSVLHGVTVPDPYRWLEDEKSPEVQAWMKAQDDLARSYLSKIPGRDAIAARLSELLYVDTLSAPLHRGNRYFYTRRLATKEKAIVFVREGRDGPERVLLDPNAWTKDGSDALGTWRPSWDGKLVAYNVHHNNSDEAVLHVLDVASGNPTPSDVIEGTKYADASWTPGGDGFYYTWVPTDPSIPVADRPGWQTVKFHRIGQDAHKDVVVVDKLGDPTTSQSVELSKDGRWLVRTVAHGWRSDDVYFRDTRAPTQDWTPLVVGQDALYDVHAFRDRFYVATNEGAPHWRVFVADPAHPARARWKEIVPERPDAVLDSAALVGGKLALAYLKDVLTHVEVHDLDGKLVREVPLPELGTASNLEGREDDDEAYFSFESFTAPVSIYRTSVKDGGADLVFRIEVPADSSRYVAEQIWTRSKDGTRIPIFLVHAKDQKPSGDAPALLTGYGGFLVSEQPTFRPSIFPWLERGGIYALAILRGGGEYGEEWHRAGMLTNKQNVFDDFLAAADALVQQGWTRPDRLAIRGGSNGGLLVAAAETQRPAAFGVVLCHVPLVDMVRYHLFGSGKTWIGEYGSADDPEQFKAILAYSPQQHVSPGVKYPATLILSADADDRVDPMHARKFAAALQNATTGGPVLLRIERHSGHLGADLIKATIEKTADEYAFALQQMGAPVRQTAAR